MVLYSIVFKFRGVDLMRSIGFLISPKENEKRRALLLQGDVQKDKNKNIYTLKKDMEKF